MIAIFLLWSWTGFKSPESAVEGDDGVYVSDVGDFSARDGVIWHVSGGTKEKIAENLTDPKGLAFSKGKLYIADVDRIWRIDFGGEKAGVSLLAGPTAFPENPRFLNGMTSDATGYLYTTDTFGGWVYMVSTTGRVTQLFKTDKPNGITVASDGTVYVITFTHPGRIYSYTSTKGAELVYMSEDLNGGDGLKLDEDKGFLYAGGYDSGKIVRINLSTGKVDILADSLTTPADFNISLDGHRLLVPLLEAGEVMEIDLGY